MLSSKICSVSQIFHSLSPSLPLPYIDQQPKKKLNFRCMKIFFFPRLDGERKRKKEKFSLDRASSYEKISSVEIKQNSFFPLRLCVCMCVQNARYSLMEKSRDAGAHDSDTTSWSVRRLHVHVGPKNFFCLQEKGEEKKKKEKKKISNALKKQFFLLSSFQLRNVYRNQLVGLLFSRCKHSTRLIRTIAVVSFIEHAKRRKKTDWRKF